MLRERIANAIDAAFDAAVVWLGLAMMAFIGYALSRHIDVADAVAVVFGALLLLRAIRKRGAP